MLKRHVLPCALALLLGLLCACGTPADSSGPDQSAVSVIGPGDISLPPDEPVVLYTNPLTGEATEEDISQNRPVAIMLNNLKKALPQHGVADADMIYEVCAEGGITRMMAVFQSPDGVGNLGSVRSSRPYYVELAAGLDAIYIHAGGSDGAYQAIKDCGVFNIDGVNGPYGGTMFWRDAQRRKTAGFEHSLFTSDTRISDLLGGKLASKRQVHNEGYSLPLTFADDGTPAAGQTANTVKVKFSHNKTGVFTYDAEQNAYLVSQHNAPYVDGNTSQQVAVTNVLVVMTDIHVIPKDKEGRLDVDLVGSGSGWFACGGKYVPITWSKASPTAPLTYSTADGQPLTLGVGSSYINIVDVDDPVTFG
ncbi:MAG: DUF3048 domain-containing protein [Oscillospiraceae bacterium]|nr:DUF3048 domain-containing protein [Oscillospiraceae bacterium]